MAFTNPDATFALQADRVYRSYNQALEIRDRHGAKEGDTRCVSMNNIAMASNASTATLRLMHWAKKGGDGLLIQALGLAKPEYINFVGEDLLRSSRLFLLLESQFQLETAFRNILLALVLPIPTGFYNVSRDVLAAAGVSDAAVKLRVLNVPALMRNSMHANGIHYGWKGSSTGRECECEGC